ncbi:MAG: hypothetical protein R3B45_07350 [Bdellovibrionota bacterium]
MHSIRIELDSDDNKAASIVKVKMRQRAFMPVNIGQNITTEMLEQNEGESSFTMEGGLKDLHMWFPVYSSVLVSDRDNSTGISNSKPILVKFVFPFDEKTEKNGKNIPGYFGRFNIEVETIPPLPSITSNPQLVKDINNLENPNNEDALFYPEYGERKGGERNYDEHTTHYEIFAEEVGKTRFNDCQGTNNSLGKITFGYGTNKKSPCRVSTGKTYPNDKTNNSLSTRVDRPLKAGLIYAAMDQIRNTFHIRADEGAPSIENRPLAFVDPSMIEGCLSNNANHWSDLTLHFYCQLGYARICYTEYIRHQAGEIAKLTDPKEQAAALKSLRVDAFESCMDELKEDKKKFYTQEWEWIRDAKVNYEGKEYQFASIFEYIMTSSTFMFNLADEQKVLNAFYRADSTLKDCESLRPRRFIDSKVENMHCQLSKSHEIKLEPKGR